MKRIFLLGMLALLASLWMFGALVNAAPPLQDNAPTPTRDPIKQATRRAKRAARAPLPAPATATPLPEAAEDEAVQAAPVAPGAMTSQILVFNPDTSGEATVQIDVYDASGAVSFTTTQTVAKNGAKLVTLPGSLGANFQGGAQISSDKNVQAMVLTANNTKTAFDAYEGAVAPALDVTLPLVRHLALNTQNSQLAIQNTTANAATTTVTFYNADGSVANTTNLNIAAHQSAYLNTNAVFPGGAFAGSVRVVSNQNVAVASQTLYTKDTAAFSGIDSATAANELYLSQAQRKINGNGIAVNWSEIFVRNNGGDKTTITLNFYSSTGQLVTSLSANDVASNGTAQFSLNDAASAALGTNFVGWARVSSSGEPLTAASLDVLNKGKRMTGINAASPDGLGTRFVCGDVARMTTENSQLKILNPGDAGNAKVIVRLFDKDSGAKIAQTKVVVAPQSVATVMLSDSKFAAAGTNFQGMALVFVKGAAPPPVLVTASNPYANPKLAGTTGYTCSKIQ